MNRPSTGIVVASTGSGVGKTSIACGLLRALRRAGVPARAAKCGPDYLDPLWLERASGGPCPNLDAWMAGEDGARELARGEGLLVVESAMGLYDGIRPDSDEGSGAAMAAILGLPVLLVVDASGSARTVAAVVQGLRDFGECPVAGIVANRVGGAGHARLVEQALASRDLPPLVGYVERGALPRLPERHLGLVPPDDDDDLLDRLAEAVAATVDLDRVRALAGDLPGAARTRPPPPTGVRVRLGLAWDEAFRFAYRPVLDRLEASGVELAPFSPIRDRATPPDLDGLWLCGGYPELHAADLAANASMRRSIAAFCATGAPVLAECGGLLYLSREMVDGEGIPHPMCGVVPARGSMGARLGRLGYRTARARVDQFLSPEGASLRGHEFHYGRLEGEPEGRWRRAWDLVDARGRSEAEGWWDGAVLATWFHGWLAGDGTIERWIAALRGARERRGR